MFTQRFHSGPLSFKTSAYYIYNPLPWPIKASSRFGVYRNSSMVSTSTRLIALTLCFPSCCCFLPLTNHWCPMRAVTMAMELLGSYLIWLLPFISIIGGCIKAFIVTTEQTAHSISEWLPWLMQSGNRLYMEGLCGVRIEVSKQVKCGMCTLREVNVLKTPFFPTVKWCEEQMNRNRQQSNVDIVLREVMMLKP